MKTERVPIGSVQVEPANVRRHGEKNLDAIKASLSGFGQQKPIVVDADGTGPAGEALWVRAMAFEGWSTHNERPVEVISKLWPSNQHRTMAGMAFNALHKLDIALEERKRARDEDVPF